jgi:hypothetical protein
MEKIQKKDLAWGLGILLFICGLVFLTVLDEQLIQAEWAVNLKATFLDNRDTKDLQNIVYRYGGKYGLADKKTHEKITKPFAKYIHPFNSHGIAVFEDTATENSGLVNNQGDIIMEPVMTDFKTPKEEFENPSIMVYCDADTKLWGIVDSSGKIKVEPSIKYFHEFLEQDIILYSDVAAASEKTADTKEDEEVKIPKKLMTTDGEQIDLKEFYEIEKIGNNYIYQDTETLLCGIADEHFNVIKEPFVKDYKFNEEYFSAKDYIIYQDSNDLYSLLNHDGIPIREGFAGRLYEFRGGCFLFKDKDTQQIGVIDTDLNVIVEPKYKDIEYIYIYEKDEVVYAYADSKTGKKGLMKPNGELLTDPFMYFMGEFNEYGIAPYYLDENGMMGIINTEGKIIQKPFAKSIDEFDEAGIAKFYTEDFSTFGFMNRKGEILVKPTIKYINEPNELGWSTYKTKDQPDLEGIIDKNYNIIEAPFAKEIQFDSTEDIENYGVIVYKDKNKKEGLLNLEGKIICSAFADEIYIEKQKGGPISFKLNDKYGLLDTNGTVILEAKADYVKQFEGNKVTTFSVNNKVGLIDNTGKIIREPFADQIRNFDSKGEAYYYVGQGTQRGIINTKGEIILESK